MLNSLTEENLIALVANAGEWVGMGHMRPEQGGTYGRFRIVGVQRLGATPLRPYATITRQTNSAGGTKMAKSTTKKETVHEIVTIQRLERGYVDFCILGVTPLVMNRPSAKAKQQLLLPPRQVNKAARQAVLKHDPVAEFRETIYRCRDDKAPTFIHIPTGAFKKALVQAALDTPGATKAEVGRLVQVTDETVFLYGKPFLYMDWVRQAGISHAPDIRTRAMFPEWACRLRVQYIRTLILEQAIVNLMGNAGDITGVGDGRTEKGTYDHGGWELVTQNDPRWNEIVKKQGRAVQQTAYQKPESVNEDTEELWAWYESEIIRREADHQRKDKDKGATAKGTAKAAMAMANNGKRNGNGRRRRGNGGAEPAATAE